jgi:hypothetical protein
VEVEPEVPAERRGRERIGPTADLATRKEYAMTEVRESSAGGSAGATQAREKAQEVAGRAQEKGQEAAAQGRDRLRDQVDRRSTQAGQRTASTAGDVRSVAQELRNQGKEGPARVADQVADRGERLGSYLERSDADRILQDVEDFGRRQPWAVVAGGIAVGFLASRFLKASSRRRYETYRSPAVGVATRRPVRDVPIPASSGATPAAAGDPLAAGEGPLGPSPTSVGGVGPPAGGRLAAPAPAPSALPVDGPEQAPDWRGTAGRP